MRAEVPVLLPPVRRAPSRARHTHGTPPWQHEHAAAGHHPTGGCPRPADARAEPVRWPGLGRRASGRAAGPGDPGAGPCTATPDGIFCTATPDGIAPVRPTGARAAPPAGASEPDGAAADAATSAGPVPARGRLSQRAAHYQDPLQPRHGDVQLLERRPGALPAVDDGDDGHGADPRALRQVHDGRTPGLPRAQPVPVRLRGCGAEHAGAAARRALRDQDQGQHPPSRTPTHTRTRTLHPIPPYPHPYRSP